MRTKIIDSAILRTRKLMGKFNLKSSSKMSVPKLLENHPNIKAEPKADSFESKTAKTSAEKAPTIKVKIKDKISKFQKGIYDKIFEKTFGVTNKKERLKNIKAKDRLEEFKKIFKNSDPEKRNEVLKTALKLIPGNQHKEAIKFALKEGDQGISEGLEMIEKMQKNEAADFLKELFLNSKGQSRKELASSLSSLDKKLRKQIITKFFDTKNKKIAQYVAQNFNMDGDRWFYNKELTKASIKGSDTIKFELVKNVINQKVYPEKINIIYENIIKTTNSEEILSGILDNSVARHRFGWEAPNGLFEKIFSLNNEQLDKKLGERIQILETKEEQKHWTNKLTEKYGKAFIKIKPIEQYGQYTFYKDALSALSRTHKL